MVNKKTNQKINKELSLFKKRLKEIEQAGISLKQQNELAELIYKVVPSAIFTVDTQKRITSWNNTAAELTAYNPEEVLGKECILFTDYPCKEKCGLYSDDITKPIKKKECTIKRKDGAIRIILKSADLLRDKKGNIIGGIESFEDITERKKLEERLKEIRVELEIRVKVRTAELMKANEDLQKEIAQRKKSEKERKKLTEEILISNKRMKKLLLMDFQTGLYNYRYLQDAIEAEFYRAKRYVHPLSIIMLDIDYFKSINDAYGHQFGDLVLKQFARQLKMMVRRYDIVIRYGGEEFIVVSPGVEREQAMVLGQRILDALNLYNFGDKEHSVKLKISLAVASYPDDSITGGVDLINLADKILNKAKEYGGNRVYSGLDIRKKRRQGDEPSDKSSNIKLLKGKIEKLNKKANQSFIEAILAFAKTIELKDHYTGEHVENTVHYATETAKELGLDKDEVEIIKQAAMLHDLGKIGISDKILLKKSKLTKKEFEEIKKHPQIAADILRPVHFFHSIIPVILYHHERWDGKGYPSNLKDDEIPLGARIIAIADVYQALTSDRPYRKAYSKSEAVKIIKAGSGTQFDPRIVAVFLEILKLENCRHSKLTNF